MNREQTEFCHFSTTEGQPFHTYRNTNIDIALSDIGKKFVKLKAFSLILDQSDNETA
jgi:hypothetical protein